MTRAKRRTKKDTRRTKKATKRPKKAAPRARRSDTETVDAGAGEMPLHLELPSILTGGDVDADRQRAWDSGEEAVGGSVVTPDQDVVDQLGRALGVEQAPDDEVRTSAEILRERDRHRWRQEG